MKVSISLLLSLLTSAAVARPHLMDDEEGDPAPQTSRVTAFVIDKDGTPSVECWEFSGMTPNQATKGGARVMTLATSRELQGVDLLTWPEPMSIWPPPVSDSQDVHANWLDLTAINSLFSVQQGLLQFVIGAAGLHTQDDSDQDYIFSMENGDNWFYFEDNYDYNDDDYARRRLAEGPPISVNTASATETELLRLRFPDRPTHKVLHKGGCRFTGISISSDAASHRRTSRVHNSLRVQKNDL